LSKDYKKISDSLADPMETREKSILDMLNQKVREPNQLLFYAGALFESTKNTLEYSQSQLMIMAHVPTKEQTDNWKDITLFASPPGSKSPQQLFSFEPPTEDDFLQKNWTKVKVSVCPDKMTTKGPITAFRRQYTLKHIGSSTVS